MACHRLAGPTPCLLYRDHLGRGNDRFLCWVGAARLYKVVHQDEPAFHRAKGMAITGLTLGFCLWFLGFIGIGGEWFLMWQSEQWNAQQSAFRIAILIGLVLLFLCLRDP